MADLDRARAERVAAEPAPACGLSASTELLAHDDVDLVLNLTVPAAHAEIARLAIAAGKAVYGEKPLAATTAEARDVLEAAAAAGAGSAARRTPSSAPASRPRGRRSTTA